ncbi:hypothetical protein EYF80_043120 [Liparis tanakae]|uniref:Uncharacterized protein n=1 Tax=Liparis tanakae TaxID=230148 RepID=A0A4Z2G075_9TELE|nr:hypothetical protein EYF80_043120 [Liparis tanakae]
MSSAPEPPGASVSRRPDPGVAAAGGGGGGGGRRRWKEKKGGSALWEKHEEVLRKVIAKEKWVRGGGREGRLEP